LPYLVLNGPEGYLSELFVREPERGKGIGRRLMEVIEVEARARGCSTLMLVNSRSRESYRRGFYKELGWDEREGVANFIYRL
jgi:GNAT superfamily N-acetyltransferase